MRFEIELQIVGDEEIEMAVAVVVDESAAGAPARFLRRSRPASLVTSVKVPSPLLR